jgi:hypothetical protein
MAAVGLQPTGSTREDGSPAAQGATVAVDRGDVDQRGDPAAGQAAQFGQLGHERAQRRRADAGYALQQLGVGLSGRGVTDRLVDVFVEIGQFGVQHGRMPFDDPALTGAAAAILFGDNHLDDPGLRQGRLLRLRARPVVRSERPWRLFGLKEPADRAQPCSAAGLSAQGARGLPSAIAALNLPRHRGEDEIQGVENHEKAGWVQVGSKLLFCSLMFSGFLC